MDQVRSPKWILVLAEEIHLEGVTPKKMEAVVATASSSLLDNLLRKPYLQFENFHLDMSVLQSNLTVVR